MRKIKVNLQERSYSILVGEGITEKLGFEIEKYIKGKKIMIITNSTVNRLYGKKNNRNVKKK